jgi:hypothetical protein
VILKVGKSLCTVIRLQMAYIQSNSVSVQLCFLHEIRNAVFFEVQIQIHVVLISKRRYSLGYVPI